MDIIPLNLKYMGMKPTEHVCGHNVGIFIFYFFMPTLYQYCLC